MDGLGLAANIIAVVDISFKLVGWCIQYAQDVENAKDEKSRLSQAVIHLNLTSKHARELLNSPKGTSLKRSQALLQAMENSNCQLKRLEQLLGHGQKTGEKARLSALRWPFRSKEAYEIINDLRQCSEAINSALQADVTSVILSIDQQATLDRLPVVEGAAFDSHADEHHPTCLPATRVQLLKDIDCWIEGPDSKTIFWLNGKAGTGKSTIARTVAQSRSQHGDLGASFFFKRGETDRGNLNKFVPTLARQLALSVPATASTIKNIIDTDPAIVERAVPEQFNQLIREPLSGASVAATSPPSLVIVIDALDECERDTDIRLLINILSQTTTLRPRLRVFLTSRPELPIRLGFSLVKGTYNDLILDQIPIKTVEHDISIFLTNEFSKIRDSFNVTVGDERKLPSAWPGQQILQNLTKMAAPLFIFAATVCLFIGDRRCGDPSMQLSKVLDHRRKKEGKPVLGLSSIQIEV